MASWGNYEIQLHIFKTRCYFFTYLQNSSKWPKIEISSNLTTMHWKWSTICYGIHFNQFSYLMMLHWQKILFEKWEKKENPLLLFIPSSVLWQEKKALCFHSHSKQNFEGCKKSFLFGEELNNLWHKIPILISRIVGVCEGVVSKKGMGFHQRNINKGHLGTITKGGAWLPPLSITSNALSLIAKMKPICKVTQYF